MDKLTYCAQVHGKVNIKTAHEYTWP